MAKAIPELNLCVLLEKPGTVGNFCTRRLRRALLPDYDSVGRSRFRSESAVPTSEDSARHGRRSMVTRACLRGNRSSVQMLDSPQKRSYDLGLPLLDPAGQTCPSQRYL